MIERGGELDQEPNSKRPPTVALLIFMGMWAAMAIMGGIWSAFGSNTDGGVVYLSGGLAWVMAGLTYVALRNSTLATAVRWTLVLLAFGVGAGAGYFIAQALIS